MLLISTNTPTTYIQCQSHCTTTLHIYYLKILDKITYFQCAVVLLQEVLYVGDHIFGDIIKSKKEQAFRSHNMHVLVFNRMNGPGLTMRLTFPFQDVPCHSRTDVRNRFMGRAFRSGCSVHLLCVSGR